MTEDNQHSDEAQGKTPRHMDSRMVFVAVALIAFVWLSVFIILPGVTGKPGVAQQMQQDLQEGKSNGALDR